MPKTSLKKNYILNLAYEFLSLLAPLITTPYISPILEADGIGVYSFTLTNATYFTYLAALGTTVYARREIAYLQEDKQKRTALFWEIMLLRLVTTLVAFGLYCGYCATIKADAVPWIQGLYIVAVFLDVTWLFQGMENFGAIVLRNTIIKIIGIAFIFIFIKTKEDLFIYILGFALIQVLSMASLWIGVPKLIGKPFHIKYNVWRHLKPSLSLFLPTIAAQVYLLLDKTMIGFFSVDSFENGYYEQVQKIIRICYMVILTMGTVMAPRVAACLSAENRDAMKLYIKKSFHFVWIVSLPISFGLFAISGNLVPWFFGDGYDKVRILLCIFCWVTIPMGLSAVTGSVYLIQTRRHKYYNLSVLFAACVNFALNLYLIPSFFSIGASIASVIAEVCIVVVQSYYIIHVVGEFQLKVLFNGALKSFFSSIIMFVAVYLMASRLSSSFVHTLSLIVVGAIVYMVCLFIFKDALLSEYLRLLINKCKIRK